MTDSNTHRSPPDHTPPADQDWFGGRRWTGIAAIGVLILIALCVLIVVVLNRGGGNPTGAGSHTVTPGSTAASSPSSSRSSASLSARPSPLPTATPTAAPAGVVWRIYQTVALPSLRGAGPAHVDRAYAAGYARTPTGALLAASNDIYRIGLADDAQWPAVTDATIAPGPGKQAWIAQRRQQPFQSPTSGDLTQLAGFQYVSYTPTDAVIELVSRDVHDTYQVGTQHMVWSGNDWRLALPASGVGTSQNTDSLAGFIPWSGV